MDELGLIIDFHRSAERQGPGSDAATQRAIALSGLASSPSLTIADIGCGTGASALVLAQDLQAQIKAVDLHRPFLDDLQTRAAKTGVAEQIEVVEASMDALPFDPGSLDAIWSEGAIYSMGFAAGVSAWRQFLKPGGVLAVSELTWLTKDRPAELTDHWRTAYPEVAGAAEKIAVLESEGFSPLGYFPLDTGCWLENYYRPMQARFDAFQNRHGHAAEAVALVEAEKQEIDLYERHVDFVSYGFYVARLANV